MIKSVGQSIASPLDVNRLREGGKTRAVASTDAAQADSVSETVETPAARMAAQGAPVDLDKVARIKQAIASGNYPVDPEAIADSMISLDLPGKE